MAILWINLVLVYIFSLYSRYFSKRLSLVPNTVKPNKLMIFCVVLSLVLISGLRNNIGDTIAYMHIYTLGNFGWKNIKSMSDPGFKVLQMLLIQFSKDPQILIFVTALITNIIIVIVLYQYSRLIEISLYVYIASGMFLVSMNGIRQFLTAAIVFAATKYIFSGNWVKYTLVVLFAATLHASALILIPIYFFVRRKAWTKSTYLFIFIAVMLVIGFSQFSEALFSVLEETQYGHYKDFQEGGASIIRVAVTAIPIILAYYGRDKLRELFPNSDCIVNMSILGLIFMLIATQNWIFARFTIYFGLYGLILISWVVNLFSTRDQKLIYFSILGSYLVYFYYEHVIALGIIYRSDYIGF
ncbi:EpsG family protein [Ammoniphilus sp. YIM 78166]|uniref:EpsG family protein n=1 Tax=Ammoniphilus sp. YIM 78166 TaxID=1644106 RepID=UPI0010703C3B|nr:EpsG family protein [Ammoniphilus sp. YIM 78166]